MSQTLGITDSKMSHTLGTVDLKMSRTLGIDIDQNGATTRKRQSAPKSKNKPNIMWGRSSKAVKWTQETWLPLLVGHTACFGYQLLIPKVALKHLKGKEPPEEVFSESARWNQVYPQVEPAVEPGCTFLFNWTCNIEQNAAKYPQQNKPLTGSLVPAHQQNKTATGCDHT